MKREVWIGLVEVWPKHGSRILNKNERAFVSVLAWSSTQIEYRQRVRKLCDYYWLMVKGIEKSEPFRQRSKRSAARREVVKLVEKVERHHDARFGTFHVWVANQKRRQKISEGTSKSRGNRRCSS